MYNGHGTETSGEEFESARLAHQSLTSTAQAYLPTFNSSLSMVVVISAHFPTEDSLFHAHVPLSATEVLLSQDQLLLRQITSYGQF